MPPEINNRRTLREPGEMHVHDMDCMLEDWETMQRKELLSHISDIIHPELSEGGNTSFSDERTPEQGLNKVMRGE